MVRYLAQRLLSILVILVAIAYFGFLGMNMYDNWRGDDPGYHFWTEVRQSAADTVTFTRDLVTGNLGEVQTTGGPQAVGEAVWFALKNSLGLLLMAVFVAALLGLAVGNLAALGKGKLRADGLLLMTIVGISAPSFLIAILLQHAGIKVTQNLGQRVVSMGGYGWDLEHLLLPLLVLAARPLAYLTRAAFLALTQILDMDYMRTALAKGLPRRRRTIGHALPNLAIPFLTAIGVSLRFSLSSLPVVEFIFAWPGVGWQILEAIRNDVPVLVVSLALVIGLSIQVINLSIDLASILIDPRIGVEL